MNTLADVAVNIDRELYPPATDEQIVEHVVVGWEVGASIAMAPRLIARICRDLELLAAAVDRIGEQEGEIARLRAQLSVIERRAADREKYNADGWEEADLACERLREALRAVRIEAIQLRRCPEDADRDAIVQGVVRRGEKIHRLAAEALASAGATKHLEVRYNHAATGAVETEAAAGEPTSVDEIVGRGVDVHLEYLGQGWFLEVDGRRFNISDEAIRASEESLEQVEKELMDLRDAVRERDEALAEMENYRCALDYMRQSGMTADAMKRYAAAALKIGAGADSTTSGTSRAPGSSESAPPAPPTSPHVPRSNRPCECDDSEPGPYVAHHCRHCGGVL